jgi:hypothetical protein
MVISSARQLDILKSAERMSDDLPLRFDRFDISSI